MAVLSIASDRRANTARAKASEPGAGLRRGPLPVAGWREVMREADTRARREGVCLSLSDLSAEATQRWEYSLPLPIMFSRGGQQFLISK